MLHFDEPVLKQELARMTPAARLAFAVAAAERQLSVYETYAVVRQLRDAARSRHLVAQLWERLRLHDAAEDGWSGILDELMDRIPAEDPGDAGILDLLAQQAMSSLAYAIRCLLSSDPQEAAWAGLCEYEAADQAAIRTLQIDVGAPGAEAAILVHDYVQRCLRRQQDDARDLARGDIDAVARRTAMLPTFTREELARLA